MSDINDRTKEASALASMQRMLEKYAAKYNVPFEEAMEQYASSESYSALFDYNTGLWREGPDYLLAWFEQELEHKQGS